jgi:hypothetical protein
MSNEIDRRVGAATPLIVRIGGLPADAVAPFSSDLPARSEQLRCQEASLAAILSRLVDSLHDAIHGSAPSERGLLLAVKRAAFNQRSLHKYACYAADPAFPPQVAPILREAIQMEAELATAAGELETAYQARIDAEKALLLARLDDTRFLRGLAMSSPLLAERLPLLKNGGHKLRERRMLLALLRYVSRAALKLSPFSTLTVVGLGTIDLPSSSGASLELVPRQGWSERSLVILHRSIVERMGHLLFGYPQFRSGLRVAVNCSLQGLSPGRYTFIRPARWEAAAQDLKFLFVMPCRVKVDLRGPVTERLLAAAHGATSTYAELCSSLQEALPEIPRGDVQATVDHLIEIGFISVYWPWEVSDPAPEARLLEALTPLREDGKVAELCTALARLGQIMAEFPTSPVPGALLAEGRERIQESLRAAAELGGVEPQVGASEKKEWQFHENVFVTTAQPAPIATLLPSQSSELLRSLSPLARLSEVFNLRHDLMLTFSAFAAQRWPSRKIISFLEFFEACYPLFQEFIRFDRPGRRDGPLKAQVFNPSGLTTISELLECRTNVLQALDEILEDAGTEFRLQPGRLIRMLDSLPTAYTGQRSFCAFLQPINHTASVWVLNNFLEGLGRMGCRYTPAMNAADRDRFTSYFRSRSRNGDGIREGQICDLFWPGEQSVNVHAYQTELVLEVPGQSLSVEPERRLSLSSLDVLLDGDDGLPVLIDPNGHAILPLHLGALAFRFLPSLAKFITLFGPGDIRFAGPAGAKTQEGDVEIVRRHVIDNVIYRRRSWSFPTAPLRASLAGLSGSRAFLTVDRWRRERGIPEVAYLAEPLPGGGSFPRLKPQYVDFTSTLFVELFKTILEHGQETLKLVEALPAPADLPETEDGTRFAVEIQFDSFGIVHSSLLDDPTVPEPAGLLELATPLPPSSRSGLETSSAGTFRP